MPHAQRPLSLYEIATMAKLLHVHPSELMDKPASFAYALRAMMAAKADADVWSGAHRPSLNAFRNTRELHALEISSRLLVASDLATKVRDVCGALGIHVFVAMMEVDQDSPGKANHAHAFDLPSLFIFEAMLAQTYDAIVPELVKAQKEADRKVEGDGL